LEMSLSIPRGLAERVVADPTGEPLLVVAKMLGMSREALQRVLLFINPAIGQSVQQVYELTNLYDGFSADAAAGLVESGRGTTRRPRPAHQSVYWDDERGSARAASTASRYPAGKQAAPIATRLKNSGGR